MSGDAAFSFSLDRVPDTGPAYERIQRLIRSCIGSGEWSEGSRLPPERTLAEHLGVARETLRSALRDLTTEGVLMRQQGSGTFVAPARPRAAVFEILDLADEIRARGGEHRAEMLALEEVAASPLVAVAAGVRVGARMFHSRTLHFDDGVPVQLEDRHVLPEAAPEFLQQDFQNQTPSGYLLANVPFAEAEHRLSAVTAGPIESRLLRVERESPLLLLERRTFAADTSVVTVVRLLHPGERYRLGGRFRADRQPPAP